MGRILDTDKSKAEKSGLVSQGRSLYDSPLRLRTSFFPLCSRIHRHSWLIRGFQNLGSAEACSLPHTCLTPIRLEQSS